MTPTNEHSTHEAASPPNSKKSPFNCLLDAGEYDQLTRLADAKHTTRSAIIRELIRARFSMTFQNAPTCSDCSGCRCPQMHPPAAPIAGGA